MENTIKIIRPTLALMVVLALTGCAAVRPTTQVAVAHRPLKMSITQVGFGRAARYVYCDEKACPKPSRKTPVASTPIVTAAARPREFQGAAHSVDVGFPPQPQVAWCVDVGGAGVSPETMRTSMINGGHSD